VRGCELDGLEASRVLGYVVADPTGLGLSLTSNHPHIVLRCIVQYVVLVFVSL
jgi:hypothetical protein